MGERRSGTRRVLVTAGIVLAVLVGCVALRSAWLSIGASEGDVPAASSLHLPAGTEIVDEQTSCASGGCWNEVWVRPTEGQTPEELAHTLGATPETRVPGTLWDPRGVHVRAEVEAEFLVLRAGYRSSVPSP